MYLAGFGLFDFDELLVAGGDDDGGGGGGAVGRLGTVLDAATPQAAVLLQAGRRARPLEPPKKPVPGRGR